MIINFAEQVSSKKKNMDSRGLIQCARQKTIYLTTIILDKNCSTERIESEYTMDHPALFENCKFMRIRPHDY